MTPVAQQFSRMSSFGQGLIITKALWRTPDIPGERLVKPLKWFHESFSSRIEDSTKISALAWRIAEFVVGLIVYPVLLPLACVGYTWKAWMLWRDFPSFKKHSQKIESDWQRLYNKFYLSLNPQFSATNMRRRALHRFEKVDEVKLDYIWDEIGIKEVGNTDQVRMKSSAADKVARLVYSLRYVYWRMHTKVDADHRIGTITIDLFVLKS